MVGILYIRVVDGVSSKGHLVLDHEVRHGAACEALLIGAQVQDRVAERRRVAHQTTYQAEMVGCRSLPHKETEVLTTCGRHTGLHEPAERDERYRVLRVSQNVSLYTGCRQHLGRIHTQVAKNLGDLSHYADTMLCFHLG